MSIASPSASAPASPVLARFGFGRKKLDALDPSPVPVAMEAGLEARDAGGVVWAGEAAVGAAVGWGPGLAYANAGWVILLPQRWGKAWAVAAASSWPRSLTST